MAATFVEAKPASHVNSLSARSGMLSHLLPDGSLSLLFARIFVCKRFKEIYEVWIPSE